MGTHLLLFLSAKGGVEVTFPILLCGRDGGAAVVVGTFCHRRRRFPAWEVARSGIILYGCKLRRTLFFAPVRFKIVLFIGRGDKYSLRHPQEIQGR